MKRGSFERLVKQYGISLAFEIFCSSHEKEEITPGIVHNISLVQFGIMWDRLSPDVQSVVKKRWQEIDRIQSVPIRVIIDALNFDYPVSESWVKYLFEWVLEKVKNGKFLESELFCEFGYCSHVVNALLYAIQKSTNGGCKEHVLAMVSLCSAVSICHFWNLIYLCAGQEEVKNVILQTPSGLSCFSAEDFQVIFNDGVLGNSFLLMLRDLIKPV